MSLLLVPAILTALIQTPRVPGIHEATFQIPDLGGMRYAIMIPDGYAAGEPRPLVLVLHPGGARMPYYGRAFLEQVVRPALDEDQWGAIMVAPDCPTRAWTDPTSHSAVMALLAEVLSDYAIDRTRILVTGFSLGGRGTWFMATRHPDLFTAAIPMAGSPPDDALERLGAMPVYAIHSRDDEVVPFGAAEQAVRQLKDRGQPVEFAVLRGVGHFEMGRFIEPLRRAGRWVRERWDRER